MYFVSLYILRCTKLKLLKLKKGCVSADPPVSFIRKANSFINFIIPSCGGSCLFSSFPFFVVVVGPFLFLGQKLGPGAKILGFVYGPVCAKVR